MHMKMCSKCKKVLPLTDFCGGKNTYSCKPCMKEYKSKNHEANKDERREKMRIYHQRRMQDPEYRAKHNASSMAWRKKNPGYYGQYYSSNKDSCKAHRDRYRAKPETKIKRAVATRRRQVKKCNAQPAWANTKYIALFYKFAKLEEVRIGEPVNVDHIIPLQHPKVCGLHCEHNLQLLTADANRRKFNNF